MHALYHDGEDQSRFKLDIFEPIKIFGIIEGTTLFFPLVCFNFCIIEYLLSGLSSSLIIASLFMLFKKLNSGGLFIIEELDFPDTRGDMNLKNEKPTLREILFKFKIMVEYILKFLFKHPSLKLNM